jgi:hypothetical protein
MGPVYSRAHRPASQQFHCERARCPYGVLTGLVDGPARAARHVTPLSSSAPPLFLSTLGDEI